MTILLVDDDDGILEIWKRWLAPLEAEIRVAQNVEKAIEQMRRIPPPDIVLLDLVLPPHSALQTAAEIIRLRDFNSRLIVIAISGLSYKTIVRILGAVVVDGIACKDENMGQLQLLRTMQTAIQKRAGVMEHSALLDRVGEIIHSIAP